MKVMAIDLGDARTGIAVSDEESYFGRTYADSPDVDGKIWFTSEQHVKTGDFVRVRIVDMYDGELVGIAEDDIDDDGE